MGSFFRFNKLPVVNFSYLAKLSKQITHEIQITDDTE